MPTIYRAGETTRNVYQRPIDAHLVKRVAYDESPAHVGPLRNSVDIIVPVGTPIRAAQSGRVVDLKVDSDVGGYTKEFDLLGNFVEIEHDHGEFSEYEHLKAGGVISSILLAWKDKKKRDHIFVKKGQIMAYSGATGWLGSERLGPHLHFMVGVYPNGNLNAYRTLEIRWEGASDPVTLPSL